MELFVWSLSSFYILFLPKNCSKRSQIVELCVSLSNTQSRAKCVSEVTAISPPCRKSFCNSNHFAPAPPQVFHFPHPICSTFTSVALRSTLYWWRSVEMLSLRVLSWHTHITMPALCHITRIQGSSITSATQTLSRSHSTTQVWHINVKQISLTFISPNNTTMAGSQAHQPTILTSYRRAVDLIKYPQLLSSIHMTGIVKTRK